MNICDEGEPPPPPPAFWWLGAADAAAAADAAFAFGSAFSSWCSLVSTAAAAELFWGTWVMTDEGSI